MNLVKSKCSSIPNNITTLSNLNKNPSSPLVHTSLALLVAPFSSRTCHEIQHPNDSLTSIANTNRPKIVPFSSEPLKDSIIQTPISSHYVTLLKSCVAAKALSPGEQIHARLWVMGFGLIPHLGNKLVNLYCACGSLRHALLLFDRIPKRNIFLWNIVIRAFAWYGPFEIAAQAGKWEEVSKLRNLMTNSGIKKDTAYSWIEVKNKVHAFLTGDTSHPMHDEIWAELKRIEGLITEAGYVPDTGSVFHDVEDDEKTHMVRSHGERLAIAFGLISTLPGTRLLIIKNLRICEDCHIAIKFISKVTDREITVRDVNRYHHFKDGSCSCGDYW